jgi:hypothetical protein
MRKYARRCALKNQFLDPLINEALHATNRTIAWMFGYGRRKPEIHYSSAKGYDAVLRCIVFACSRRTNF